MKSSMRELLAGKTLTEVETYALFAALQKASDLQQAVILTLLAAKKLHLSEIMGARQFVLDQSTVNAAALNACPDDIVDIVGTGGDESGTFNISTAASLVVASCGVNVLKNGGGRVTSTSGSADLVTALGIPLYLSAEKLLASLKKNHYAYLCGRYFNTMLNAMGPIRSQLGFPTIFNVLGPLVNPFLPKRQVIGVYRRALVPRVAELLQQTGSIHALVVHAAEGLDEISVSGVTYVAEVNQGRIHEYTMTPEAMGFSPATRQEVLGGTPEANAALIEAIFSGKINGAKLDIVLINAAAGLLVADQVTTLYEGVTLAREAIDSGRTLSLLSALRVGDAA